MSIKASVHQPNLMPNWGYFYKMSQSDIFIILTQCQYEKNGFTNRYFLHKTGQYVTKPINNGMEPIYTKSYTDGLKLVPHNMKLIQWVMETLGIKTKLVYDIPTNSFGTERLIENLKHYGADVYVTSPTAKNRYLDEDLMRKSGIEIEYSKPEFGELNILEMFERFGIDGTKKQLYKRKEELCEASVNS